MQYCFYRYLSCIELHYSGTLLILSVTDDKSKWPQIAQKKEKNQNAKEDGVYEQDKANLHIMNILLDDKANDKCKYAKNKKYAEYLLNQKVNCLSQTHSPIP